MIITTSVWDHIMNKEEVHLQLIKVRLRIKYTVEEATTAETEIIHDTFSHPRFAIYPREISKNSFASKRMIETNANLRKNSKQSRRSFSKKYSSKTLLVRIN